MTVGCQCGYQDRRFCPVHGWAMRAIAKAGPEHAEKVASLFQDPAVERVCVACVLDRADHETWCAAPHVLTACREVLDVADLDAPAGDSLARCMVEMAVEEALDIEIQDEDVLTWTTPRELAAIVERVMAAKARRT